LFQVEGVIVEIVQWHKSDFVSFHVAVCGKLDRIACLQPDQVIKTDKKFILSENGQMSLF